ncbi:hypothetical protein MPTK1_2g09490 [Marchantia polymorpha subsp. ruderalis]|uniref:Import inner membrane translocase subunit n=1 Tax=Marchantia polymorpha TaxID=3197 RepID=A0A2R6W474_MARPO|nr:hypothetical protein MARPO_0158s0020 [Marchantia polymorpha]BBN01689.1 hypothetical protein Mp_2g09490 [Marchantia polymorpha subsp. ruderalis]|eukprot:PTQ28641.1 hypothetical protein MARPO_0158s0020 [Marchantia polymorpha]
MAMAGRRGGWQQWVKHAARAAEAKYSAAAVPGRGGLDSLGRCVGEIRQGLIHHGGGGADGSLRSLHSCSGNATAAGLAAQWRSAQVDNLLRRGSGLEARNFLHSGCSQLVKSQVQRSLASGSKQAFLTPRRNLSSSETPTWAQRWKETTQKFKDAVNSKPRSNSGSGASVGLKAGSVPGRVGEVLSEASSPLRKTFSHYREAALLQLEAFWKNNYMILVGVVGVGVCLLLWRLMFGIASTFISMSEGLAKFGFLALAASMVIVGGVYMRAKFTINPDSVYRIAMRKLNTSAAVLEVMGAPLSGTDLRAYIMSGGGLRFKGLRPRIAGKRCFVLFPIRGSERRGLVSVEVKKKKGKYDFKLLAVDVPTAGADQRLFLIGDEDEYKVGGGLISELRDPMVVAMAAQKEFEELDIREEEEDERKQAEAEQKKLQAELEQLEKEREDAYREMEEQEARTREEEAKAKEEAKTERIAA